MAAVKNKPKDPEWQLILDGALADLKKGIKEFGTYSYEDKGASEIMNLTPHLQNLQALTPEGAAWVISKIANNAKNSRLASDLIVALQDWGVPVPGDANHLFNEMYHYLSQKAKDLY